MASLSNLDYMLKDMEDLAMSYRSSAKEWQANKAVGGMGAGVSTGMQEWSAAFEQQDSAKAEQYRHYKGWAYVAIKAIAQRVASQPLKLADMGRSQTSDGIEGRTNVPGWTKHWGQAESGDIIEAHPLLDAVMRPNEIMTQWSLMFCTVASLQLTGASYWWFEESEAGLRIWPLPSHWVTVNHNDGLNASYRIIPNGNESEAFTADGKDIAYFSLPDPSNPLNNVSPLQTQAAAVSTDEAIQESQFRAFKNGIFPGVIMTVGRLPDMPGGGPGERPVLEPEQRRILVDAAKLFYQGAVNYNEPMVVDGMIEKIEKFSNNPQEMDYTNSGNIVKSRIFQAFGVNPLVLGEITAGSHAQSSMADKHFCNTVVNPLLDLMGQVITGWMVPYFNFGSRKVVAYFEPAVADDEQEKRQVWQLAIQSGVVTPNEVRSRLLHLPDSEDPAADTLLMGAMPNSDPAGGPSVMGAVDDFLSSVSDGEV